MDKHTKGKIHAFHNGTFWDLVVPWSDSAEINRYCRSMAHVWTVLNEGDTFSSDVAENAAANARRLMACWNACDGIDTDMLESGGFPMNAARKISETIAERDALLRDKAELASLLRVIVDHPEYEIEMGHRKIIRAALAKHGGAK